MTRDEEKVFDALIRIWLRDSRAGRGITTIAGGETEALAALKTMIADRLATVVVADPAADPLCISIRLTSAGFAALSGEQRP